mmetsp:Transcript_2092/g.4522  ORF Transcript_2092/g.4522 Transcript_2092/m.4522 type:complete len:410 (+) Transcript_2092:193-1422(+)|eukprot:CAMPEP_0172309288 /NCGR_PEP_ID=MMETSP1058-20130122/9631_1 /TAXON_ID=83371 /ORGANISM="Detonula confervacea, Strain CCMP 353" /LENGTH=409 /DNA_ID=CAMNT_0013021885 /DNA_START=169 /DNA_END=1398 /DNA_ORIENTATION=+
MALPAYAAEIIGHVLLFFLVFGMSATVDLNGILKQLHNSKALCMGIFLQFGVLPFLGFVTVKMLALDNAMGLTLLVVTSSPGGSYSNWWCSVFNADLALSVTMTAISTVLAVVMLPLNLSIYAPLVFNNNEVNVMEILDFRALLASLIVVFSAIGLGIFASCKVANHNFHIFANRFGSIAGVSLIVLSGIVSSTVDGAQIWERDAKFYFGVAMPCVIALIVSNIMTTYCGLKKPERVTSCIECCYQNCGIATSVALSMFQGDDLAQAMGVPFFYGVVEFLLIGMYCIGSWKAGWTKAPPTEPLWKVVTVNYEVLLAEKLVQERNSIEVQLSKSCDVEGGDGYYNEQNDKGGAAACLYYCHEPDLADVDPPAPSTDVDTSAEKTEKLVAKEARKAARPLFWRSLGYKVQG